jgi:hypothetical protein
MRASTVYLVRKRALGDVLWIEPVIRQLSVRYKKVIVHTKYNVLFNNYPLKNVFFKERFNFFEKILSRLSILPGILPRFISLDMAYEKRPKMHLLNAYQLQADLPLTTEYPKIYLSDEEKNQSLSEAKNYVILHNESFSDKNFRKIYGIDWNALIERLNNKGFSVIQIGKNPIHLKNAMHISTSVREIMVLINKSKFFLGIDSGPSHIAATIGKPSLIFFGAVNPDFRHFRNLFKGHILQQACEFAGCYHETNDIKNLECRLVGENGIPKCSLHNMDYINNHIDLLINEYNLFSE